MDIKVYPGKLNGQIGAIPSKSAAVSYTHLHTDGTYSKSKIVSIDNSRVKQELDNGNIVIVAGFQGIDESGEINTLGRGGSDLSLIHILKMGILVMLQ